MTLQAPLDLMSHMAQVTEQLSQQPRHAAEPSFVLGPIQNEKLSWSLSNRTEKHTQVRQVLPSNPKRPTRACASVFFAFGARCNN